MSPTSSEYLLFLAVVLILYYVLPHRVQNLLLLVASYAFYALWDYRFLFLLVAVTALCFFCGKAIGTANTVRAKRTWLIVSLLGCFGALGFFKYFDFFTQNASRALGMIGLHSDMPTLNLVLPLGISFYVFQAASYSVDVYHGHTQASVRLLDFALFVAFFPKIIAGPIERAAHLLPQLSAPRSFRSCQAREGIALIIVGLFKKAAIADPLSPFIDPLFIRPEMFSTPELLRAMLFFTLQIYCDFSGYSDIACGAGLLLGIELTDNFQQPYLSTNIAQFWRRWHISLSNWLRDYLYIPLGGNRRGRLLTYFNLMVTMLIGGLWHGASWNFVVWGGLHGFCLIIHRMWKGTFPKLRERTRFTVILNLLSVVGTFALVSIAWVFFKAWGTQAAFRFLTELLSFRGLDQLPIMLFSVLIPWVPVCTIDFLQYYSKERPFFSKWSPLARAALYAVMILAIILGSGIHAPFIYQQF